MPARILLLPLLSTCLYAQAIRNQASFNQNQLERNDDGSSSAYALGFQINFLDVCRIRCM
jgi:hypothetical protein